MTVHVYWYDLGLAVDDKHSELSKTMFSSGTSTCIQWSLSITALRIKDTSVIRTAIETCTYLTSELRTPLYSVLRTHDPPPNGHIAWLTDSIIRSRPRPQVPSLVLALQFHMDHHEDGGLTRPKYQISIYHPP